MPGRKRRVDHVDESTADSYSSGGSGSSQRGAGTGGSRSRSYDKDNDTYIPPPHSMSQSGSVITSQDYEHNSWRRQSEPCSQSAVAQVPEKVAEKSAPRLVPQRSYEYHKSPKTIQDSFLVDITVNEHFVASWEAKKYNSNYELEDLRKHWISLVPKYKWYKPKDQTFINTYMMYFQQDDPYRSNRPFIVLNGLQKMYVGGKIEPVRSADDCETVFIVLSGSIECKVEGIPTHYKVKPLDEMRIPPDTGYTMLNSNDGNTFLATALVKPDYDNIYGINCVSK